MENHRLVSTQHLNHHGRLFGGYLLAWVDEFAYMAVCQEFQITSFVTVAMDKAEFLHGVDLGSILRFVSTRITRGTTSVTCEVEVEHEGVVIFSNRVTFVHVGPDGKKKPLP